TLALTGELERHRGIVVADRKLATELVYGVLRRRGQLDAVIAARLSRPLNRVDAEILDILRLATYQLAVLDRVPDYAAVNEAVEAARRLRGKKVAAFVNAVLRRLQREIDGKNLDQLALESAKGEGDAATRLAISCSLPLVLAREWSVILGDEAAEALGRALLTPAPITIRAREGRIDPEALKVRLEAEGARVDHGRYAPGALRVHPGGGDRLWTPGESASYHEGLWTVQDEAAQLVSLLLAPTPGERVLDACCGLGGKTTHLAEIMGAEASVGAGASVGAEGPLFAVDKSARKLDLLDEHLQRLGLACAFRQGDLTAAGSLGEGVFDRILLDAPCSGLGVLRRHPD
ncbi:MAG: 16S rRNA (cytosine(967)-C(5))-methyltransferase RsmB, partial [Deltaproteobacteria bacterium]|nr:16S rRNA (cytosine(967)-C(5))-methyltransferase RsmB [Deltaproteobacteria bacterium]